MIIVFVVDTSPSMNRPVSSSSAQSSTGAARSLTRLDLAKMAVEDISRRLRKGLASNLNYPLDPALAMSLANLGQGGSFVPHQDALLLLSTSRQYPDTASCAAEGRLLVGFGTDDLPVEDSQNHHQQHQQIDPLRFQHLESFQKELKSLQAATWDPKDGSAFPEDAGGAAGLNAALSTGLQLLSRYRLHSRYIENFGQGRLPCASVQVANEKRRPTSTSAALQPACLILVTDGACLRHSPDAGGGSLQLQYGSQPLREFYKEPFRWDQRIFCLAIGDAPDSKQYLHPQLRALVDVTGGAHMMVRKPSALPTDAILKGIRPVLPRELPLNDPLFARLPVISYSSSQSNAPAPRYTMPPDASFINGGPICCFQALEGEEGGRSVTHRTMLLYTASPATSTIAQIPQLGNESRTILSSPLWCIPESYFPTKKLDALPPRSAQPLLFYSKYPANLGSKSFEPIQVIKLLHKLDQMVLSNRRAVNQPAKCLHRDLYICEWLSAESDKPRHASMSSQYEYFPVFCRGSGRPTLSDDADNILNIGILHVPITSSTSESQGSRSQQASLTLLPPEPHILLPLLIRAVEAEQRAIRKFEGVQASNKSVSNSNKLNVILDEHWRSELQAYLFRLPPYYQHSVKRCLRSVLPSSVHALLHSESSDSMALQCFSKNCLQKIRNAEQIARDTNERLERQEASLRRLNIQGLHTMDASSVPQQLSAVKYGNYDPRMSVDSYLETLRSLPPPWRTQEFKNEALSKAAYPKSDIYNDDKGQPSSPSILDALGELPATCLMAYYESRRRWMFGGPPVTTQGLHVDGVANGGSNVQRCGTKSSDREECLLSIAGIGVSTLHKTSTALMGNYKERLVLSRSPIVGYGSNDATGVAATTAADGSPVWSVDDEAMPETFFDARTGEFADSLQTRSLSKIMVNFGNPFREKRAVSIVPAKFLSQAPSTQQGAFAEVTTGELRTPPGSPPHSSFESVEEGEAVFVTRTSPSRVSPKRDDGDESESSLSKRPRTENSIGSQHAWIGEPTVPPESEAPMNKPPSTPRPPARKVPAPPPPVAVQPIQSPILTKTNGKPAPPKSMPTHTLTAPRPPPPPPPPPPKVHPGGKPPPPSIQACSSIASHTTDKTDLTTVPQRVTTSKKEVVHSESQAQQCSAPQEAGSASIDYECPDKMPNVSLPPGWICVWSKSQARWYFFDQKTNKSVWKWPADA